MKTKKEQVKAIKQVLGGKPEIPDYRFSFGKYKGHLLKDVHRANPGYLRWLKANATNLPRNLEQFLDEEI